MTPNTQPLLQHEIKNTLDTLHFLSETTTDQLFLWDLQSGRFYFAGPICERYSMPPAPEEGYTIQDWKNLLHPLDFPLFSEQLTQIRQGKQNLLNAEYRLMDSKGHRAWNTICGKVSCSHGEHAAQMIGRISDAVLGLKADPLTGLLNAAKLMEDLAQCLSRISEGHFIIFGIDNFKTINVKYGRGFGDLVLKQVTEVLEQCIDPSMRIYRADGDRFAVNLTGCSREDTEALFFRIKNNLPAPYTISAGAIRYDSSQTRDGSMLYQYAENALDRAKQQGRNQLAFFSSDDYEKYVSSIELQEEIRQSIQNSFRGFSLCYQPQISCQTYQMIGAEALLRYTSPSRGMISPDELIPLLEQTELICPVGQWVLETALTQCREWRKQSPLFHISVNISYIQLRKPGIGDLVLDLLKKTGLSGDALTLEITESMQLQDYHYFNKIFYQWKRSGIQISIDDFGTGYSNLSYLKSIEINETKIDRCFVSRIQHSAYNYHLLSNLIELTHSAGIQVCCEGVETVDELLTLKQLQPDILQGYLFAGPYEKKAFEDTYFNPESPAYQSRAEKEAYYKHLDHTEQDPKQEDTGNHELEAIVESLDEIVFVCDAVSFELLYLNPAGRRLAGIYDYKGRKCYKVLHNRNSPCEFCNSTCRKEQDSFSVCEIENTFLKRHFILKDKLISWQGRMARLGIAIDTTEKEQAARGVQEQLNFEQNLTASARILMEETDINQAIQYVLCSVGKFYKADRAYLTQATEDGKSWHLTYRWLKDGTAPISTAPQLFPKECLQSWISLARDGASITISDTDSLKDSDPTLWHTLRRHHIRRLIGAPIWNGEKLLGFLNVDNPSHRPWDDSHLRAVARFLSDRLVRNDTEKRLHELLNCRYEDILQNTLLGLWVIRIDAEHNRYQLFADRIMQQLLGLSDNLEPEACYQHWYSRINDGYYHYVKLAVENMLQSDKPVELEYTWNHPEQGEVVVRCLGIRVADSDGMACLEGYHRIISNLERPKSLPDSVFGEMFEFNERKKSIYFHTGRQLLAGDLEREDNFPECWIQSEMVHPHFIEEFRSIFFQVQDKADLQGTEMLLKTKNGSYEWFKIRTRHLGQEQQDVNTIVVLIDPANQERSMELEYIRKNDFYQAVLSETVAYAEIDVESGHFKASGGLWESYSEESRKQGATFSQVMQQLERNLVHPEQSGRYCQLLGKEHLLSMFQSGQTTQKFSFQRRIRGKYRWVQLMIHIFQERYSENMYALLYLKDIDVEKKKELAQEIAANRDPLTNVLNRRTFEYKVINHMTEEAAPSGSLIILDLDNFKSINDKYGHLAGDTALKSLTRILTATFRRRDLIGRLGGDEFLVFIKDVTTPAILNKRMNELYQSLHTSRPIPLSCSAGITTITDSGFSYEESLAQADMALYRSKKRGKNTYTYYSQICDEAD